MNEPTGEGSGGAATDDAASERRTWVDRTIDLVARLTGKGGRRSERTERILLGVAVLVFLVAAGAAWQQLPPLEQAPDPRWALAMVALGVFALVVNAWEFAWSARVLGSPVTDREALRVSTLASAANVLPIPGAIAVRTRALLQGGQSLRDAAMVTTATGVAWVAAAAIAAAALTLAIGEQGLAMATGAGGVAGIVLAVVVLHRAAPELTAVDLAWLAVIELVSVVASGTRLFVVAVTFGFGVSFSQAIMVNLGGILSNIAGFLPGGLGLREVASGAFGVLVGVPVAIGVLMAALDRLAVYVVLAGVAVFVLRGGPVRIPAPDAGRDDDDAGGGA